MMPSATYLLVFINIAIYIYVSFLGYNDDSYMNMLYEKFGLVPIEFMQGAFWQPLTSLFLHFPYVPIHLLVNMIGLWSFGTFVERQLGTLRFLFLYFISGLFGSIFVIGIPYISGSQIDLARSTVGASGALMGLLGAMMVLGPRIKLYLLIFPITARNAGILLGAVSLLFAIFGSSSFISHNGHLGGLIGGFLYTYFVLFPDLITKQKLAENPSYSPHESKKQKLQDIARHVLESSKSFIISLWNKPRLFLYKRLQLSVAWLHNKTQQQSMSLANKLFQRLQVYIERQKTKDEQKYSVSKAKNVNKEADEKIEITNIEKANPLPDKQSFLREDWDEKETEDEKEERLVYNPTTGRFSYK